MISTATWLWSPSAHALPEARQWMKSLALAALAAASTSSMVASWWIPATVTVEMKSEHQGISRNIKDQKPLLRSNSTGQGCYFKQPASYFMSDTLCPMPPCATRVLLAVPDVVKNAAGEKDRLLLHQAPQHDANWCHWHSHGPYRSWEHEFMVPGRPRAPHGISWNRMASQNRIVQCLPCYWNLFRPNRSKFVGLLRRSPQDFSHLLMLLHFYSFLGILLRCRLQSPNSPMI